LYPISYVVSVPIDAVSDGSRFVLFPTRSTGIIKLLATTEFQTIRNYKNAGTLTNSPTTDWDNAGIICGSNPKYIENKSNPSPW